MTAIDFAFFPEYLGNMRAEKVGIEMIIDSINTPAVQDFISKIEGSRAAVIARDYGRNGRLGDLVQDVTDPPESDGKREFLVELNQFTRYHCYGDEGVLSVLDEIGKRIHNDDLTRLLLAEDFYSQVATQMEWYIGKLKNVSPVIEDAFLNANKVRIFSNETVRGQGIDSHLDKRVTQVERADASFVAAVELTKDPEFWIDIRRFG